MPLSNLPLLKTNLEGMLDAGNELLASLEKAKPKPHVLDDVTINHMRRVYTDQKEEIKHYQNSLAQWLEDNPTKEQKAVLKTYGAAIHAVTDMHQQVFFLIDFFKERTINKILAKGDAKLAMDMLTGKIFPP